MSIEKKENQSKKENKTKQSLPEGILKLENSRTLFISKNVIFKTIKHHCFNSMVAVIQHSSPH